MSHRNSSERSWSNVPSDTSEVILFIIHHLDYVKKKFNNNYSMMINNVKYNYNNNKQY